MIRITGRMYKYYHVICEHCGASVECIDDDFSCSWTDYSPYINCPLCGKEILKSSMEKVWRNVNYGDYVEQYNTDNGTNGEDKTILQRETDDKKSGL